MPGLSIGQIGMGLGRRSAGGGGPPPYNPSTDLAGYLFGIQPWNIGTLFTDTAGTVAVTAPGDLVACVRDPFTNAIVATQATSGNRPIYQVDGDGLPYLQMSDGVTERWLSTATINFTTNGIGRLLCVAAIRQDARPTTGIVIRNAGGNGAFTLIAPDGTQTTAQSRGSILAGASFVDNVAPVPRKMLLGFYSSIPNDNLVLRLDKTQRAQVTTDQGTTLTYNNSAVQIGANSGTGGTPFQGRLYGLIFANSATTDYVNADIVAAENYLDARLNP